MMRSRGTFFQRKMRWSRARNGLTEIRAMTGDCELHVAVHDGLIIVRDHVTRFCAIYSKRVDERQLFLERRRPTSDHVPLQKARRLQRPLRSAK